MQNLTGMWMFDVSKLQSALISRTKMIVIDISQNPIGKVFFYEEFLEIAGIRQEKHITVIVDGVYNWTAFEGEHVRMAPLLDVHLRHHGLKFCKKFRHHQRVRSSIYHGYIIKKSTRMVSKYSLKLN